MKRTVPRTIALTIAPPLLALSSVAVQAEGLYIRIGDGGHGHRSSGSGFHTHGPVTSFSNTYGPVTSFGSRHILSGRNQYNLNITRPGHDIRKKHFKSFHDHHNFRKDQHHHKGHGSGYLRGFRDGFRAGQQHRQFHRW